METTETITVSLPTDLLAHLREFADLDKTTLETVLADALRQYEKKRWWDKMNRANQPPAG